MPRFISLFYTFGCICWLAFFWIGCSTSQQVQQDESATPADTTTQSTSQGEDEINEEEAKRIKALKQKYREELTSTYQSQANEVSNFYILAQRRFYNGEYDEAMNYINNALETRQNADLLALKGNIHLGLGNTDKFAAYWKKALKKDKDVPLPLSNYIIEALKSQGVLNENMEPDF